MNPVTTWVGPIKVQFKKCTGYMGEWACTDPDHMVPIENFYKDCQSKDGLFHTCKACASLRNKYQFENNRPKHPLTGECKQNWKRKSAIQLGGIPGTESWQSFLDMSEPLWDEEFKSHLLNTAPAHEVLEFLFPETKESVMTQRTVNHKPRNQALVLALKELYNYTCQVEGCNETEVSLAHIYKHSLPDSVDNETNALCLCNNHHSAYDGDRLVLHPALDGRFIRYNRFGKVVEIGRIIYDEKHVIDVKWIKKSRDYHDSKK